MTKGLLLVCLLWATAAQAQSRVLHGTVCPGDGCLNIDVAGLGTVGVQVTGSLSGTLQFEQTIDGTWTTWSVYPNGTTSAVTSSTGAGFWYGPTAAKQIRVRFSTYNSGTPLVSATTTQARLVVPVSGGDGTPGGSSGQLQYNSAGSFGGLSRWSVDAGQLMTSTATGVFFRNQPTENTSGSFGHVIGVASNGVDPKPDHTMIIGWNVDNGVSGAGSNGLSFESYCSLGTGCLAGAGGQSETYFSMDDGKGNPGVRPLGFFQRKNDNNTPYIYTIARSDLYSWFNAPASGTPMLTLSPTNAVINVPLSTSLAGSWLTQQGVSLIEKGSDVGGVAVAPSSGVDLGNAGEYVTNVRTNHIRTASGTIEDASGHTRIAFAGGDDAEHLAMQNSPGSVLLKPLGTATNIDLELNSKGSGYVVLNPAAGGGLKIDGIVGVTASGSSCTITAVRKGIVTGVTCTP